MLISKNLFKRETLFVAQIRAEGTCANQNLLRIRARPLRSQSFPTLFSDLERCCHLRRPLKTVFSTLAFGTRPGQRASAFTCRQGLIAPGVPSAQGIWITVLLIVVVV